MSPVLDGLEQAVDQVARTAGGAGAPPARPAHAELEAALAREHHFHAALGRVLAGDAPEQGLAEVLHDRLGLAVAVEDAFGHGLARAGADALYPRSTRSQRACLTEAARRSSGPLRMGERSVSPAGSRGILLGALVVLDPEGTLVRPDETDPGSGDRPDGPRTGALRAIGLATAALTLHLVHRRRLARTELWLQQDLVETVLAEPAAAGLTAEVGRRIGRASALDHDLTGPHRVLALQPRRRPDDEAVAHLMDRAARILDMPFLGTLRGRTAILVCGTPGAWLDGDGVPTVPWADRAGRGGEREDDRGRRSVRSGATWQVLQDAFAQVLPDAPVIGIGGYVDRPEHLPRSYREAMQALTVGLRQAGLPRPTAFEDLGLYRLLATPDGRREASAFVEDWLGSLLAYDGDRQADLVRTLGAYLDHGGNYDDTAAALYIHRSTLRYRLQRIRELSGHDLAHADTRLNLHVAVRAAVVVGPPVLPTAPSPRP